MTGLVGCGESGVQPAGSDVQLTETIPKAMAQAAIPGAIVGVWQDDAAPYVQAFGVRDTATGDPMAPDLFMRVGSVTKTFTTTAVLQLVDQGKVGLDDSIARYVPGVPNGDTITIRQLAAMRSGLPDFTDVVIPALPSQPQRQWTPQELLEISFSHPPLFAPGAEFDYCNTNTTLLGLVVEKASGQQLDAYIAEHITRPENLGHTSVPTSAAIPSPHAQGYTKTPDGATVDATDWNPSWGFGAGNMISTLDDLRVWARDLAEGTLLSPATQREREQFQLAPSEGTGSLYGLGVEYQNGWIGHNGNIAGYQTYAYYLPPESKTVVVMVNSNVDPLGVWDFFTEIVRIVSPDHPWPAPPS
ncbi:D-alanyl-D-alanine carboxypeptidase [Rhodococcus jostii]|uniref:D-alanyl-D-alanine carboxypeptidase n=2 Tax=Rhodococcus jostii TaxID=132919 RepID=A0A1H4S2D2_RHOJO|nr:D-alanyl-D-alanine carboxypeptidase [Rhodococcus jostii]